MSDRLGGADARLIGIGSVFCARLRKNGRAPFGYMRLPKEAATVFDVRIAQKAKIHKKDAVSPCFYRQIVLL